MQPEDRMLKWFRSDDGPEAFQFIGSSFSSLANRIVLTLEPGPERTVALRKLLESMDAAMRAVRHPGG